MRKEYFKIVLSYLLATAILTLYGGQVCPFLESISALNLYGVIGCSFICGLAVRFLIFKKIKESISIELATNKSSFTPFKHLIIDIVVWIFIGFLILFWNSLIYDFPLDSGLKMVLGSFTVGFFASLYLALEYEAELIKIKADNFLSNNFGSDNLLNKQEFLSISVKFLIFLGISYLVISSIIILLIWKDIHFVYDQFMHNKSPLFYAITWEIFFVFLVIFGGSFFNAIKYSRNLKLIFNFQLKAFESIRKGELNTFIPIVNNDELGQIASHSNFMIQGLQEREKLKATFGKYLSPKIAAKILANDNQAALSGKKYQVAVLFTDIRDYTKLSEKHTPEQMIKLLNQYFTMIVKVINRHQGVVDKFIGDAAMAVFGLDNESLAAENSVKAAIEIRNNLENLNKELSLEGLPKIDNGVGIHFGPVIAGNMGSPDRLEYTVIGDTVNTASRLEALSKENDFKILMSSKVEEMLKNKQLYSYTNLGMFDLRGKSEKINVYGVK